MEEFGLGITKKLAQVILGTFMIALSINLLITAHEGYDTISTFLLGILNIWPIPFWVASLSFNVIVLIIVFLINKSILGMGSIINGIGLALMIGFLEPIFIEISIRSDIYHIFALILAPLLFGVGAAVYVAADQGAAALEALTSVIYEKTGFKLKMIRIALDALFVLVGLLLGASIGIGTLLCVICIGPIFEFTLKKLKTN
ncbi:YczE/YyaS/YitT family protein [Enterococcus sp. DIV0240a]|uniref:YczE/YyaS/YitT family protein n=1 Tax=unclassified Enterococcus TaxID=2608891 RepID=UPI003D2DFC1E